MKSVAILVVVALLGGCTKQYKVRVVLTPEAADRRLASGKSDVVDGYVKSGDGTSVYVDAEGTTETISRDVIVRIDQREAKRDVKLGIVFGIAGTVLLVGGFVFMDCDENDFPLFCAFYSKDNLWAGIAIVGGIALTGAGIRAIFQGLAGQSQTDAALDARVSQRWRVTPTVVVGHDGAQPGIGLARRF